jgi:hypothetical protein
MQTKLSLFDRLNPRAFASKEESSGGTGGALSKRKSLAGWRSAPALNPKMRRGPKRFAC